MNTQFAIWVFVLCGWIFAAVFEIAGVAFANPTPDAVTTSSLFHALANGNGDALVLGLVIYLIYRLEKLTEKVNRVDDEVKMLLRADMDSGKKK